MVMQGMYPTLTRQSAGVLVPPAVAGRYYDGETVQSLSGVSATALTMTANRLYAMLTLLGVGVYTKLGISVGTLASSSHARCAIHDIGVDGLPGNLLVDGGGNLDTSGTGEKEHTISFVVAVPRYVYLSVASDGAPVIAGYTASTRTPFGWSAGNVTAVQGALFRDVGSYGAPPSPFGMPSFTSTAFPRIWVRL